MTQQNEYLQLIQSDLTNEVRRSMQVAVDRDPEVEARLQNLAKRANVPLESVRLDPKPVERQVAFEAVDYDALAKQYPSTAQLLADPNTAALAKDDIEGMSMFEKLLSAGKRGFLGLDQGFSGVGAKSNAAALTNVEEIERKLAAGEAFASSDDIYGVSVMTPEQREEFKQSLSGAVGRQAGDIAALEMRKPAIPQDPTVAAAMQAKTFGGFWQHFTKKPFEFIATLGAESAANMIPGLVAAIPAGIAGGPIAAAAALGGGSFATDYGSTVLEALQSEGVDLSNPAAIKAAVANKELVGRVGARAFAHASVVGALDAASGGVASITLAPAKLASRPVLKNAANLAFQSPVQGLLGALGEAGGQVASGQELHAGSIAAEFFGEFVGTPGEVLSMSGRKILDTMQQARVARENVSIMQALGEAAGSSKLLERAPERFRDFIKKAKEGGEIRDVFIPVEQFRAYFQSVGIDPAQAAADAGIANYQEAVAAGTDVVIPLENYVTSLAPTEHHAALMQDVRLHQGDMTLREAEQFESERDAAMSRIMEEAREAAPLMQNDPAVEQIEADILGQLVSTGTERGTAESYAKTYAKGIATLASRSGMDPLALHERYGLTINRPMPDILTSRNRTDINLDPLLDRMRSGDMPGDAEIFGPSLTEFIRSIGGMRDDGGELRRMEVDAQNAPFVRNLIQAGGRAIDEVTALAREAGYQVDDILQAIDEEVRGNPVYASGNMDEFLLGLRDTVNQLGEYLNSIGIDIGALSNEQIRKVMDEAIGSVYEQQEQADQLRDLARLAREPGNDNRTVVVGEVPAWEAEAAQQAGVELAGYRHTVDMYAIRHAIKQHGDEKAEAARGQIAVKDEDIAALASVIMQPDSIILGLKNVRGQDQIFSVKALADGTMLVVEEVRKGKKAVAVESVRKVPGAKNARELLPSVLLNARNDAGADPIIVDAPQDAQDAAGLQTLFQSASDYFDTKLVADRPLAEQTYGVRYLLRNEIKRLRAEAWNLNNPSIDPDQEDARITGAQLVEIITDRLDSEAEAMAYLTALGITEIKQREAVLFQSASLDEFKAGLASRYPDAKIDLYGRGNKLNLSRIVVPAEGRNAGTGTAIMQEIVDYADSVGAIVTLSPSADFGGTVSRLKDFYKRFGFVENKGRARDFEISESMYRDPKTQYNQDPTRLNKDMDRDTMRGYIQFGPERKFNIALLEKADLSTFLHETGHFWLEIMGDLAADPNAPEQIKADYAATLKFLGVESRAQIGVEQHELFARANEAYLREGKAPSPELRSIFQKFKAWLTMIYKSIEMLNVTLTDEVRGVFDRIYASDAEIEAARNELDLPQLFATAADAGMTEQEFAAYSKSVASTVERAKDELRTRLMKQFQREKLAWWNDALDKLRAEVAKEIDEQPVYQAFDALTKGEQPDGTPFKLDKAALVAQFGKAYVKRIARGYGDGRGAVYSTDGKGLHHDAAADLLGYGSGAELVEALVAMRPRNALIEAEAKQRMVERHGDLMVDGTIGDEAVAAMHNEERANLLRAELLAIRRKQIEVAPFVKVEADKAKAQRSQAVAATDTPPVSVFRDAAKGMIGQQQVRDIRPYPYLLAERKASKAAFKAMAKGDHAEAAIQKQRELLNHYLYLEATDALETADAIYTYARKFTKGRTRAKFGKAGDVYLEQIDDLLEQYEFADVSKTDIVRREKLLQFVRDKMADDEPVMIPDAVLIDAEKRNYKTLPFDQLLAVRDAIRNIEHLVDLKTKLLKVQSQRALEELVAEGAASIEEHGTKREAPIGTRTWLDSANELRAGYFAAHRKIASLFREMDGWQDDGFMWNTFMKPINDAANEKAIRAEDATKKLAALFDKLQKPGLANKVKGLGLLSKEHYPSLGRSLSRADLLALALNYGNEGNRQRIRDGYGWTDQQVLAALNRLEAHEWDFVQGMWDLIDSYWPEIAAQDKRVNGIAPEKVERSGFILPNGRRIEGGYYPIKYDERHSVRSYTDRAKEEADRILRGAVARPGVDTGFTEARAGKVIDRKIKLDLGVGLQHIDTILQTMTHREMLIDINRILGSTKINGAILEHYGIETYKAIQEAVVDIAAGEIGAKDAVEAGFAWLRSGVTVAGMGLNLSTALMQPLGISQSMVRIGPKWVGRGIARFLGDALHMESATKFVYDKSDMMRLRSKTMNREIAEIRNRVGKGGVMPKVEETYFYAIVKMQAVVDVPTWLGAYEKFMEQTGNDEAKAIALADQAVIDAQGGGQTKDLAAIQRGGPLKKLFTTFYSYFSATWNLTVESAGRTDFRKVGDVGRFMVDMLLLYSVPVVLTALLKEVVKGGEGPGDDEEWWAWAIRNQLGYMLGNLVGARELSAAVQGMYGYSGPAGTRFFSEAGKLVTQAGQGEVDEALVKAANNTAGILFRYPAGQVQRTATGFMALKDGSTSNPLVLVFGPRRDD